MGRNIAIKGENNNSGKVIRLLEMLGGKNPYKLTGEGENEYYYINLRGDILCMYLDDMLCDEWILYTYESFYERYPYILGDRVRILGIKDDGYIVKITIKSGFVLYGVAINDKNDSVIKCVPVTVIKGYKDYIFKCENMTKGNIEFDLEKVEYEIIDGKLIIKEKEKKIEYPKTYKECCEILHVSPYYNLRYHTYEKGFDCFISKEDERYSSENKLNVLSKLLICRDAYWKVTEEKMGLDKPWDLTYGCGEWGYWIGYNINENKIYLQDSRILVNHTLVFPTEEIRNMFYENFKDLIEQCKEFL